MVQYLSILCVLPDPLYIAHPSTCSSRFLFFPTIQFLRLRWSCSLSLSSLHSLSIPLTVWSQAEPSAPVFQHLGYWDLARQGSGTVWQFGSHWSGGSSSRSCEPSTPDTRCVRRLGVPVIAHGIHSRPVHTPHYFLSFFTLLLNMLLLHFQRQKILIIFLLHHFLTCISLSNS